MSPEFATHYSYLEHPYRNGYDVLPRLKPLTGAIFDIQFQKFLQEKQEAAQHQQCYFESDLDPICEFNICEYIRLAMGFEFQNKHANSNFQQIGIDLREDIAIHCLDENRDWLAAAHISFPSGWFPEEKIGKSFEEIHKDVPGIRLDNSRKMVEAMIHSSPYQRYVWTVIFEDRINGHPRMPKKQFDPQNPKIFVRYERQVIIGFPDFSAALFIICQHVMPEIGLDKPALKKALEEMTTEQRTYKGLDKSFDALILALAKI